MAAPRKLKVFQTQIGFYDTVVAASSQPAALRAWGMRQDLFASGHAKLAEDPQAIEAARAHPETPLKRAVGSNDAFALEAAHLPDVPAARGRRKVASPGTIKAPPNATPAVRATASKPKPKPEPKPKPMPKPDRGRLEAAEAKLQAVEADRREEETAFARRLASLEEEMAQAKSRFTSTHRAAKAEAERALAAYRRAGGEA